MVVLFLLYQVFSSLLGHLHFSVHFSFTFMEQLFKNHPLSPSRSLYFPLLAFLSFSIRRSPPVPLINSFVRYFFGGLKKTVGRKNSRRWLDAVEWKILGVGLILEDTQKILGIRRFLTGSALYKASCFIIHGIFLHCPLSLSGEIELKHVQGKTIALYVKDLWLVTESYKIRFEMLVKI